MSGRGGPKVSVLSAPAPVAPVASHTGFVLASHPERQSVTNERGGVGKLCEMPVQPLSRSLPVAPLERSSSSGPPAAFLVVQASGGVPVGGLQCRTSLSGSAFGGALPFAFTMMTAVPGFLTFMPFFFVFTLSGTRMSTVDPHAVPERSVGAGGSAEGFFFPCPPLIFRLVSGGCGVHAGTLGSVWFGQSATLKSQTSLGRPSVSQASRPSLHWTTFAGVSTPSTSNSL